MYVCMYIYTSLSIYIYICVYVCMYIERDETEYAGSVEQRRDRVAHSGRAAWVGGAPVRRKVRTSAFLSYMCVCVCV